MSIIQFVRSYSDLSTEQGFQFEFFCDRCGSGYQTPFVAVNANIMKDVLDAAGNMLGGVFYSMANLSEKAHSVQWKKARDEAFKSAVESIRPYFQQCIPCGQWVDKACWNARKKCCNSCVENMDSAPETDSTPEAATRKPRKSTKKSKNTDLACRACNASIPEKAKFCPECGDAVSHSRACPACGTEGAGKFCAECGEAL